MLVTRLLSNVTSSHSARLALCTMLPSIVCRRRSGAMIWPQSCATVKRRAHTLPVVRFTSTSATTATRVPPRVA